MANAAACSVAGAIGGASLGEIVGGDFAAAPTCRTTSRTSSQVRFSHLPAEDPYHAPSIGNAATPKSVRPQHHSQSHDSSAPDTSLRKRTPPIGTISAVTTPAVTHAADKEWMAQMFQQNNLDVQIKSKLLAIARGLIAGKRFQTRFMDIANLQNVNVSFIAQQP